MFSPSSRFLLIGLWTLVCLNFAVCDKKRYDSYRVLQVKVETDKELAVMKDLYITDKYDFWGYPNEVMVTPSQIDEIKTILDSHGMEFDVLADDVQTMIDNQFSSVDNIADGRRAKRAIGISAIEDFDYSKYHRYAEIDQWVKDIVGRYPNLTEEVIVGRSYEKRVQRAIKIIGTPKSEPKEVIWLQGGIHAREWISPATNIYMANQFIQDYLQGEPNITRILDQYEIYVLPSVNPDGYDYTWNTERLWRKTRSVNLGNDCMGVDPNRNWDAGFGGIGSSSDPCSNIYRGPYVHSEIEVKNVVDYITERSKIQKFAYFNDIHAAALMMLSPYGYKTEYPPDYEDHMGMGEAFANAALAVNGTYYPYGVTYEIIYPASGTALDWGYDIGIKYSYSLELRDPKYSFLLPERFILPTAKETYAGMVASFLYMIDHP